MQRLIHVLFLFSSSLRLYHVSPLNYVFTILSSLSCNVGAFAAFNSRYTYTFFSQCSFFLFPLFFPTTTPMHFGDQIHQPTWEP
jgi:hypothetical protein